MSLIDLSTNLGNFLPLRNPLWIASAHYSHKASVIKAWKDIAPAALTLKTSHKEKELEQKSSIRQRTDKILPRFGRSLYVDGAKQDELLTYADTQELLNVATEALPDTAVGISVLGDVREDYKELRTMCGTAKFCELNLKYSFRAKKDENANRLDQFSVLKKRFEAVTAEIHRFCEAFEGLPIFIKLSRELNWLPDTDEFGHLIQLLKQHGRAGLIVANSLKIDIPPFIAEGTEQVLTGGVICGERLFDDTIISIGRVKKDCDAAKIPIVATGGMISPEQILTAFRAGAAAVQLCTTFDYNKLNFYNTVCWYLQNRTEARGLRNFGDYVERLRGEGIASVYSTPFMYYDNFNSEEFQKRIQLDVRRSHRMDVFIMSGKSLFSKWADPLRQRFSVNLGMRLLLPRTDGSVYVAIQQAWGLNTHELQVRKDRVVGAKHDIQRIWDETSTAREDKTPKETLRIFETEQCPFYSFYLFDDKVYIAPYPFTRPGELNSPVYVFSIGSAEYSRVDEESGRLFNFALQAGVDTLAPGTNASQ